jgi:hypothetical protein
MATCIITNCRKVAPASEPFCVDHRDRTPAAGDGELKPDAWLIRETKGGKSSISCGHMFKSEQAATSAAERMTNYWRTCVAVPVTCMLSFDERLGYEDRILAAEMEVEHLKTSRACLAGPVPTETPDE